jgi:hypothetical protein
MQPEQLFVSYSHLDRGMVAPITKVLRIASDAVFRDEDNIEPGKLWADEIALAISSCDKFIIFWSIAASESEHVALEYRSAMNQKKDIVPILLDNTPLTASLKNYQWIDFRPFVAAVIFRLENQLYHLTKTNGISAVIEIVKEYLFPGASSGLPPYIHAENYLPLTFWDTESAEMKTMFQNRALCALGEDAVRCRGPVPAAPRV